MEMLEETNIVRVGEIGYIFHPEVTDYIAGPNEEIPEGEDYARLFLEARLKIDVIGYGLFLISRKVAVLVSRNLFLQAEILRKKLSIRKLVVLSPRTILKILARKYEVVLNLGNDDFEVIRHESGVFHSNGLSMTPKGFSANLAELFGKPTGDLVGFFEKVLTLPDSSEKLQNSSMAWENLSRLQPLFTGFVDEVKVTFGSKSFSPGNSVCLTGDLARSPRFVKILQNFLRMSLIPVSENISILQAFGNEITCYPPPGRVIVSSKVVIGVGTLLLLNLFYYQNSLLTDLKYLQGMESLHRSLTEKNRPAKTSPSGRFAGTPPSLDGRPGNFLGNEDIPWLNRFLEERKISWTSLFTTLEAAKPDELSIGGIEMLSRNSASIEVRGVSPTVESIRGFLANLQAVREFRNVFLSSYRLKGSKYLFSLSLEFHNTVSNAGPTSK